MTEFIIALSTEFIDLESIEENLPSIDASWD
jgi:hypothetical protein